MACKAVAPQPQPGQGAGPQGAEPQRTGPPQGAGPQPDFASEEQESFQPTPEPRSGRQGWWQGAVVQVCKGKGGGGKTTVALAREAAAAAASAAVGAARRVSPGKGAVCPVPRFLTRRGH